MMKNMSEVSTVTLNRRVSNTKDTLVMMMALLAMLDLVVLLLMLTTTQNNNSSLNQQPSPNVSSQPRIFGP